MIQWPPLIKVARQQRWKVWRDALVTIAMWAIFLYIFIGQSIIFWTSIVEFQAEHPGAFLERWHFRMKPFVAVALLLLVWLAFFGWLSLRNWRRVTRQPPPSPLSIEREASRCGMPVEHIRYARELKITMVSSYDAGKFDAA
jgi:poly-beta-1,6-N-acetyl-D-glucosamine biosynthesis protein PgaD